MPNREELSDFIAREFPQARTLIVSVDGTGCTVRREVLEADLRPGGTVSGPTLMAVADFALYIAILGQIGIVPLAVTTSLTINFLRKPTADRDIVGVCKLLKLGKSLATGEVSLYSQGDDRAVAHVVGTYSIPPDARGRASLAARI